MISKPETREDRVAREQALQLAATKILRVLVQYAEVNDCGIKPYAIADNCARKIPPSGIPKGLTIDEIANAACEILVRATKGDDPPEGAARANLVVTMFKRLALGHAMPKPAQNFTPEEAVAELEEIRQFWRKWRDEEQRRSRNPPVKPRPEIVRTALERFPEKPDFNGERLVIPPPRPNPEPRAAWYPPKPKKPIETPRGETTFEGQLDTIGDALGETIEVLNELREDG